MYITSPSWCTSSCSLDRSLAFGDNVCYYIASKLSAPSHMTGVLEVHSYCEVHGSAHTYTNCLASTNNEANEL